MSAAVLFLGIFVVIRPLPRKMLCVGLGAPSWLGARSFGGSCIHITTGSCSDEGKGGRCGLICLGSRRIGAWDRFGAWNVLKIYFGGGGESPVFATS